MKRDNAVDKNRITLFIDFETKSLCDLKIHGSDLYSKHPSTDVVCAAFAFNNDPVQLWEPSRSDKPFVLFGQNHRVIGHNIGGFEWYIWNNVCVPKYGWPPLNIERCIDTMLMARSMGLPGSLEHAAAAAGIEQKKDAVGHRIMLKLSKPGRDGKFIEPWDEPTQFKMLYDYCKQDVEVTRELYKKLAMPPQSELDLWQLDQRINQRGVGIDRAAAYKMLTLVEAEKERLTDRIRVLTDDQVPGPNAAQKLKDWARTQGLDTESIAKGDVAKLLEDEKVPEKVKAVLKIRQEFAKSSNAKLETMLDVTSPDDNRARNLFQFYGAGTGRWSGRAIQLQNLPRPELKQEYIDDIFTRMETPYINILYGGVLAAASDCLRSMLIPAEGNTFVCADYSNIEGRVLAWLAGEKWKVKAFRDFDEGKGQDLYLLAYARAFNVPVGKVTKAQRTIGKVQELAGGYGGGVGAYQNMSKIYGLSITDEKAEELKQAWRKANPKIVALWYALEGIAIAAVENPQKWMIDSNSKIAFVKRGSFLICKLPSGRNLYYPFPKIENVMTPWGEPKAALTYMTQQLTTKQWVRESTYGGSLVENIVQALARDILADGMMRVEEAGYPITLHVHDEIVCEIPINSESHNLKEFERLLSTPPNWAKDLPLAATGWTGKRYRK